MPSIIAFARLFLLIISVEYVILGSLLILAGERGLGGSYLFYAAANVCIYFATLGV